MNKTKNDAANKTKNDAANKTKNDAANKTKNDAANSSYYGYVSFYYKNGKILSTDQRHTYLIGDTYTEFYPYCRIVTDIDGLFLLSNNSMHFKVYVLATKNTHITFKILAALNGKYKLNRGFVYMQDGALHRINSSAAILTDSWRGHPTYKYWYFVHGKQHRDYGRQCIRNTGNLAIYGLHDICNLSNIYGCGQLRYNMIACEYYNLQTHRKIM